MADEEFSRGPPLVFRARQATELLAELQESEGRLVFAGSGIANGWNGFIDNAVESGVRARVVDHALGVPARAAVA
jgi:monoamine oxidase